MVSLKLTRPISLLSKGQRGISERKPRKRGGKSKHRGISHEQVCVLVAKDRTKATVSKVACMGRIVKIKVDNMIGSKLTSDNVLVTDAWKAYKTYAKEKGFEHYRIKSNDGKHVIKVLYHIQNVNGLHSGMKQWIDSFKGVATKYLDNYLTWFLFVDSRSNESTKHNIKEFLLTSFVFEMTETYDGLRLASSMYSVSEYYVYKNMEVNKIISRKIISASVSGSMFAILLGLIVPNPFGETISSIPNYLFAVAITTPVYLMYSFPAILIYGVLTSILSDNVSQFISTKMKSEKSEVIFSGILHAVFGLILLLYSLGASLLFFITDRVLQKKNKHYKPLQAIKSLGIPLAVWLIFMGIVYLEHILNGG